MRAPTLALALSLAPSIALANPLDMYGFTSRSAALAGAVTGDVADPSANHYNPAGLARMRGFRLDAGYLYAAPSLRLNGADTGVDASHGVIAALGAPGRLFGVRFAFGLAVHLPDDRLSQVRALPQGQPRWELYGVRLQRLFIAANLAVAITPWLRVGGGLAFMASTRGGIEIEGRIAALNPNTSQLTHTVDADLTSVRYALLGAQVDLGRRVNVGVSYRDEFKLDTRLDANLMGQIVVGPVDSPRSLSIPGAYRLRSQTLTAFQPRQVNLGVAWRPTDRLRLGLDLAWVQWSRYENPTASLDVGLDLVIPPSLPISQPTVPRPAQREATRFHDTVTVRVGGEYTLPVGRHSLALRAGYYWDPTPVPAQPGVTNFVDNDRHVASVGAGFTWRDPARWLAGAIHFDVHAAMQFVPSRDTAKADPNDPVGDYRADGNVLILGANAGVEFR